MSNASPFKWRHFEAEIILLCVRWYLRYALSYRDLEEMMLERGLQVDHSTIYHWVQRYAPELEKRCSWSGSLSATRTGNLLALGSSASFCNTTSKKVKKQAA